MAVDTALKSRKIVPIYGTASWLNARSLVRYEGGLPSIKDFNTHLLDNSAWNALRKDYPSYGNGWARELVVHRSPDKVFNGKDIIDHEFDFTLTASSIPEEAKGYKGMVLIMDPQPHNISYKFGRIYIDVDPKMVVARNGLGIDFPYCGFVDAETGFPLRNNEAGGSKLWVYSNPNDTVRPVMRSFLWIKETTEIALVNPNCKFGIAYVQQ